MKPISVRVSGIFGNAAQHLYLRKGVARSEVTSSLAPYRLFQDDLKKRNLRSDSSHRKSLLIIGYVKECC